MPYSLTPGRKKDRVRVLDSPAGSDEWGLPLPETEVIALAADVRVRSGDQNQQFGVELDSEVITVLCDARDVVSSGMTLEWVNKRFGENKYLIKHIKPADEMYKSMIITAELKVNG